MIASSKVSQMAEERWDSIVERFRAACILHKEGRVEESRNLIKDELPELIKSWMKLLPNGLRQDAKADLREMFDKEQSVVDQGWKLQRVIRETLVKRIIPQIETRIASKYRSIYLERIEQDKRDRDAIKEETNWVSPPLGLSDKAHAVRFDAGKRRVRIHDVAGMIDAVQDQEAEDMADAIISLNDIVGSLKSNGIGPILSD